MNNKKKDKIEEYKLSGPNDEFPIWRDFIKKADFEVALVPANMTKFVDEMKRLFDAMAKYGIDFYTEAKEKKEIADEEKKKAEREEKIKAIAARVEICKTVTRQENKKTARKKEEPEYEEVEVEEEIEVEVPIDLDEDGEGGNGNIKTEIGPNGEIIEIIEEEVSDN